MKAFYTASQNSYKVVKGLNGGGWLSMIFINQDGSEGHIYEDHCTEKTFWELVARGDVVIQEFDFPERKSSKAAPKITLDPLRIEVDSSAVTSALAEAKELEATLLRIKAMFK